MDDATVKALASNDRESAIAMAWNLVFLGQLKERIPLRSNAEDLVRGDMQALFRNLNSALVLDRPGLEAFFRAQPDKVKMINDVLRTFPDVAFSQFGQLNLAAAARQALLRDVTNIGIVIPNAKPSAEVTLNSWRPPHVDDAAVQALASNALGNAIDAAWNLVALNELERTISWRRVDGLVGDNMSVLLGNLNSALALDASGVKAFFRAQPDKVTMINDVLGAFKDDALLRLERMGVDEEDAAAFAADAEAVGIVLPQREPEIDFRGFDFLK
jgi:hypothetical protein